MIIQPKHRARQSGFSLIELSIALAVIGVVVAGGLSMSTSMVDRQAYVQTGNQMDEVEKALAAYVAVNKRLPCPAVPTLALGAAGFGVESCAIGNVAHPIHGRFAKIGALPVRTLGLRDRFSADEYGNRYTFAVTTNMTDPALYENATADVANDGAIELRDGNNDMIINNAAYTVVSHGGDSKGAYRFETASTNVACNVALPDLDIENCNNDAIFRDARFNRGSVAGNFFDDTTRFARREIINMTAAAASSGADNSFWEANGNHIFNTNTENVGVGISLPVAKLDISNVGDNSSVPLRVVGINSFDSSTTGSFAIGNKGKIDHAVTANAMGIGTGYSMTGTFDKGFEVNTAASNTRAFNASLSGDTAAGVYAQLSGDGGIGFIADIASNNGIGMQITARGTNSTGLDVTAQDGATRAIWAKATGSAQPTVLAEATDDGSAIVPGSALRGLFGGISGCDIGRDNMGLDCYYNADFAVPIIRALSSNANKTGLYSILSGSTSFGIRSSVSGTASTALVATNTNGGSRGCSIGTATHALDCSGNVTVAGNINASGTITPSDARLKKDVLTLDEAQGLEAIRKLRPVTYGWKDGRSKENEIGFIAQEVQKLIPSVVSTLSEKAKDGSHYLGVQYDRLIAPLVLAVQQLADALDDLAKDVTELLAKVTGHDAKIKALEAENASLKLRLDAIEKKLAK